jgi:predicted HNH restriction endonuclease
VSVRSKLKAHALREKMIDYLGGSCEICDNDDYDVLTFHHIDKNLKKVELSRAFRSSTIKTILNEVNKCVLICSNCHIKIHKNENRSSNGCNC